MNYCGKCGKELGNAVNFCPGCGAEVNAQAPAQVNSQPQFTAPPQINVPSQGFVQSQGNVQPQVFSQYQQDAVPMPYPGELYCPICRLNKLQAIVESSVEGKGGGYGIGKGCIGYLLLGPLGLLCGGIGSKSKIETKHKNFFMCMSCGKKFREITQLIDELSAMSVGNFIAGGILAILSFFVLFDEALWIVGLILLTIGGFIIYCGYTEHKDVQDLKVRKYDAEFYRKN